MKKTVPTELEAGRMTAGPLASNSSHGFNGAFRVKGPTGLDLLMIISNGGGWDHVSIEVEIPYPGIRQRDPWWSEMCFVKDLCWEPNEMVIQYHPANNDYVNVHPHVLHLWKPQTHKIPKPPIKFV